MKNIRMFSNGFLVSSIALFCLLNFQVIEDSILNVEGSLENNSGSSQPFLKSPDFKVVMITNEIEFPTTMAFLNDSVLVLEKNTGAVKRIMGGGSPELVVQRSVLNQSERGMLGVTTSISEDGMHFNVFLYLTEEGEENDAHNRVYKFELKDNKLVNPELLLDLPGIPGARHNGGVLTIGPDRNLYAGIGDVNNGEDKARNQDTDKMNGIAGILRISQDGTKLGVFGDDYPSYYAYGIRNSFGMDFDPVTGNLWDTENGDSNNDEINLVEPGFNSGFNQIQGMSFNKEGFDHDNLVSFNDKGEYSDPEFVWKYTVGPTALNFLDSEKYGREYQNDLFVGDFNNGNLYHFDLNGDRTELQLRGSLKDKVANTPSELKDIIFGQGFGPITDIKVGTDGYLYILSLSQANESQNGCDQNVPYSECVKYSNPIKGTLFKIIPANSQESQG
jgi:aldose sugar dehydrogenase